jgi:hypothetical protein
MSIFGNDPYKIDLGEHEKCIFLMRQIYVQSPESCRRQTGHKENAIRLEYYTRAWAAKRLGEYPPFQHGDKVFPLRREFEFEGVLYIVPAKVLEVSAVWYYYRKENPGMRWGLVFKGIQFDKDMAFNHECFDKL